MKFNSYYELANHIIKMTDTRHKNKRWAIAFKAGIKPKEADYWKATSNIYSKAKRKGDICSLCGKPIGNIQDSKHCCC